MVKIPYFEVLYILLGAGGFSLNIKVKAPGGLRIKIFFEETKIGFFQQQNF
jgi:hypothetical protein